MLFYRWGTWLSSANYYSTYLQYLKTFIAQEREASDTATLKKLEEACTQETSTWQLQLAAEWTNSFNTLITELEGTVPAPKVYNRVRDFLTRLQDASSHDESGALQAAAAKLDLYVTGTKHPALSFFKSVRLLDPAQFLLLPHSFEDAVQGMPALGEMRAEWQVYENIISEMPLEQQKNPDFWKAVEVRIPRLASLALALCKVPQSSADVERSFSKYNQILSPQRTSLTTRSLKFMNALYFNGAV